MRRVGVVAIAGALVLAGCAQDGNVNKTGVGAAGGAVAGAVLGNVIAGSGNKTAGTAIGAAVGAAVGGGIGRAFDVQEQRFEEALAAEQAAGQAEVERVRDDLLKITLNNQVSFDTGSAAVKPAFGPTLDNISQVMTEYPDTTIQVIGHTDSTGNAAYNQDLSVRRANAVQAELVKRGVSPSRIGSSGFGESQPLADNATPEGREANRRVEIFVEAV
ncbi:MAG: OmpA family protein [Geminicoccaceae bacterium]